MVVTNGMTSTNACVFSYGVSPLFAYALVTVWDNGRSGFLGEHSCMDGAPTLRMNELMLGSLREENRP